MIIIAKNNTDSDIYIGDLHGQYIPTSGQTTLSDLYPFFEIASSDDLKTKITNEDITINNGDIDLTPSRAIRITTEKHPDEYISSLSIEEFLDENAEVEVEISDSTSTIVGEFHLMQTLINRRELFNDEESPIHDPTVTPILGEGGHLVDHANRINNLETIHNKIGWHNQDIVKATYEKPDNLLIYYGWINSFNSSVNVWNNEKVAQDMAKYNIIVLGNGLADSDHGDYSNTTTVVARIKVLNPNTKIFGYVSVNQSLANFEDEVDEWEVLEVHGIFLDEAGYDHGSTTTNSRTAFNTKVDYIHGQPYANLCFANSWNMDHVIGTANDASYPNTTWNSDVVESNLTYNDYCLLESFAVNSDAYTNDYETNTDWLYRCEKSIAHRNTYGINLGGSCIIEDAHSDSTALIDFAYIASMMYNLDAFGSSDIYYGANSAKNTFLIKPDISGLGIVYELSPTVEVEVGDSNVYHRYTQFGQLTVDFSSGSQAYNIYKY
jgi:hypothetical protein